MLKNTLNFDPELGCDANGGIVAVFTLEVYCNCNSLVVRWQFADHLAVIASLAQRVSLVNPTMAA